jgi:hypothetical protein
MMPVTGITQGNLLKTHTITKASAPDMQVSIHDDQDWETDVPIFGAPSAAPKLETGNPSQSSQVLTEGKVVDENQRGLSRRFLKTFLCVGATGDTPGGAGWIGV